MPRGPLDILKKVLGMHAQVVTKPSLATSGQLTIICLVVIASKIGKIDEIFHEIWRDRDFTVCMAALLEIC